MNINQYNANIYTRKTIRSRFIFFSVGWRRYEDVLLSARAGERRKIAKKIEKKKWNEMNGAIQ